MVPEPSSTPSILRRVMNGVRSRSRIIASTEDNKPTEARAPLETVVKVTKEEEGAKLKPYPKNYTLYHITTEWQANNALASITDGEVGFDTEFTSRRPTKEEQLIIDAFPGGGQARKAAILGWQIVELRTHTIFPIAWDKIGVRLIQLSRDNDVWVLDMWEIKAFPKELRRILASPNIAKAEAGLLKDIAVIWDDLRFEMRNLVDVGLMARLLLVEKFPKMSFNNLALQACVEELLGCEFPKEMALSDWATEELDDEQIQYAGQDAAACLALYKLLVPALQQKSKTIDAPIPAAWYTFNTRMGEPTRLKKGADGNEVIWKTGDCYWISLVQTKYKHTTNKRYSRTAAIRETKTRDSREETQNRDVHVVEWNRRQRRQKNTVRKRPQAATPRSKCHGGDRSSSVNHIVNMQSPLHRASKAHTHKIYAKLASIKDEAWWARIAPITASMDVDKPAWAYLFGQVIGEYTGIQERCWDIAAPLHESETRRADMISSAFRRQIHNLQKLRRDGQRARLAAMIGYHRVHGIMLRVGGATGDPGAMIVYPNIKYTAYTEERSGEISTSTAGTDASQTTRSAGPQWAVPETNIQQLNKATLPTQYIIARTISYPRCSTMQQSHRPPLTKLTSRQIHTVYNKMQIYQQANDSWWEEVCPATTTSATGVNIYPKAAVFGQVVGEYMGTRARYIELAAPIFEEETWTCWLLRHAFLNQQRHLKTLRNEWNEASSCDTG
ncbi:hypothetical protein C8R43DRAFT_957222 [Mycena crocata]|nr:hypothetical protein C8R43DRAFT_957222 [Mycena crocata]